MLAASCTVYPVQSRPFPYRSGESNRVCRSLMRLADPLSRKMPSTSVAARGQCAVSSVETRRLPFSFRKTPHLATTMGT